MIGFAVCVGRDETFQAHAAPSFERVREADSVLARTSASGSINPAYNGVLDQFAQVEQLEALVLMHEDVELTDPAFCQRVRRLLLADPAVAVLGTIGARGVRMLAWWHGELLGHAATPIETFGTRGSGGEVDALDGMLLVLSPWAVRNLRFDEGYDGFHAYDVDFCFTARAAGRAVFATELGVIHHTKGGYGDRGGWDEAAERLREKWSLPPLPRQLPQPAFGLGPATQAASLLIVLDDDAEAAQRCLESVAELDDEQPPHDVVIVADSGATALAPLLAQLDGDVEIVRGSVPAGRLDHAVMQGLATCGGEVVVMLHGMPVVTPGFLAPLEAALGSAAVVAAASLSTDAPDATARDAFALAIGRQQLNAALPRIAAAGGSDGFDGFCRVLEAAGEVTVVRSSIVKRRAQPSPAGARLAGAR